MAVADYFDTIQKIYIAFYQRPADPAGLKYWAQRVDAANGSLAEVIDAFANSAEAAALYGEITGETIGDIVDAIYQALFNRAPDAAGKQFYVDAFNAGEITAGKIALAVLDGSQGDDLVAINNKLAVANIFTAKVDGRPLSDAFFGTGTNFDVTYNGNDDAAAARTILAAVTSNPSTVLNESGVVAALQEKIADAGDAIGGVASGQTFMLTTGIDNFVGTAGNDTFNATETAAGGRVLGGLDVIDGGDGVDTLNVDNSQVAAAFTFGGATIKNVENINVTTNGNFGGLDISGIAGLTTFKGTAADTAATTLTAANTTAVNLTLATTANSTVTGGSSVSVTKGAAAAGTLGVAGKGLTDVTIKGGAGVVTINNQEDSVAATANKGTTLKTVTLDGVDANTGIGGEGLESVTVKGATTAARTVTITNAKVDHALTVNVDGTGYTAAGVEAQTVVADAAAKTITVNATGTKSSLSLAGSTAATTVNISGSADLKLNPLASATKIDGSAATGGLTLGTLNAATVNVSTGSGKDSLTLAATAKATVNTGEGDDTVSLASAVAAGSTINLGAGNDKLLFVTGGSVAASTTGNTTVIDGGDGFDTVSATLINAANAAQFKNFEALDLSATVTNLDVELMTGSTITALTLSGDGGAVTTAQVSNVAAGVGLKVSGDNATGGSTTINVKGAATATDNSFAVTFDGAAVSGAAATAANVKAGTVVLNEIESLSIDSVGGSNTWNSITLTDDKLKTLTITGDKNLDLAFTGTNGTNPVATQGGAVNLIDGSAATGKLSINTTNVTADDKAGVGLTVKGGSAADTITLAQKATVDAGAGDDTIVSAAAGGTFTGGLGNDKFDVALAVMTGGNAGTEAGVVATITDFSAGDAVKLLGGATSFTATKVALDDTVQDLDAALALAVGAANVATWFQYGTNTYIVSNDGDVGFDGGELVVKLTGLVDLSTATLNTGTDYLTLA